MPQSQNEQLISSFSEEILSRQKQATLAIDDSGVLRDCRGDLAHYGLADLKVGRQVLDNLSRLHGLVPLETSDYSHLPSTTVGSCPRAALHLFRRGELNWVVILDPACAGDGSIHALRIETVRDKLIKVSDARSACCSPTCADSRRFAIPIVRSISFRYLISS
jgi:hypothetical protein